jgi:hypothetical protein
MQGNPEVSGRTGGRRLSVGLVETIWTHDRDKVGGRCSENQRT